MNDNIKKRKGRSLRDRPFLFLIKTRLVPEGVLILYICAQPAPLAYFFVLFFYLRGDRLLGLPLHIHIYRRCLVAVAQFDTACLASDSRPGLFTGLMPRAPGAVRAARLRCLLAGVGEEPLDTISYGSQ
jgi:hypothetical protein